MLHILNAAHSLNHNIMPNISWETFYLINTDKNQVSSSHGYIHQPCYIYLRQKLASSNYYHRELYLRRLTELWIHFCFWYYPKPTVRVTFFIKKEVGEYLFLLLLQLFFLLMKAWSLHLFKFTTSEVFFKFQRINISNLCSQCHKDLIHPPINVRRIDSWLNPKVKVLDLER